MSSYLKQAQSRHLDFDSVGLATLEVIDRHGWQVTSVFDPEGATPPFTYTIGARVASNGHCPELVLVGIDGRTAAAIMNDLVAEARDHKTPVTPGFRSDVFGGGFLAYLGEVARTVAEEHFPRGIQFAEAFEPGSPYRILQIVWPEKDGRFPWELPGGPVLARQPLWCQAPPAGARS